MPPSSIGGSAGQAPDPGVEFLVRGVGVVDRPQQISPASRIADSARDGFGGMMSPEPRRQHGGGTQGLPLLQGIRAVHPVWRHRGSSCPRPLVQLRATETLSRLRWHGEVPALCWSRRTRPGSRQSGPLKGSDRGFRPPGLGCEKTPTTRGSEDGRSTLACTDLPARAGGLCPFPPIREWARDGGEVGFATAASLGRLLHDLSARWKFNLTVT